MNTDKMDAREFGDWCDMEFTRRHVKGLAYRFASRDAYRERQALEKAVARHKQCCVDHGYRQEKWSVAAILGTPAFERGQLVRWKSGLMGRWPGGDCCNPAEPVLDREGRPVYLPVED